MGRIWRREAGIVLLAFFALSLAVLGCVALWHPGSQAQQAQVTRQAPWLLLTAFLLWRVSRGGRISRILLILSLIPSFGRAAFLGPAGWNLSVLCLLAIYTAQIALLLSPAVYLRCSKDPSREPAADVLAKQAIPRLWMVLTALLAGVVVTLLLLGSMNFAAQPGCGPAGAAATQLPSRCFGLEEGRPLRFLTAYQGTPEIGKTALIEDWAQWSLASFSVLYLLRLQIRRREPAPGSPDSQPLSEPA